MAYIIIIGLLIITISLYKLNTIDDNEPVDSCNGCTACKGRIK